jgi:hypothetical protein
MRALMIIGIALICLGVLSLAYYVSPIRLLLLDAIGQKLHLTVPLTAAAAILTGAFILFAIRARLTKDSL